MIRAVIIDDEVHNRRVLSALLNRYCPHVHIVGEADGADTGYEAIKRSEPNLVFLDVKMPGKSGFDLLRKYDHISFDVIFVTAFDEYAIHAFEYNAVGYLLKPIDASKLVRAVSHVTEKKRRDLSDENLFYFIQTIDQNDQQIKKLMVHHHDKVIFLNISDILFIETRDGNCEIHLSGRNKYYSSKDLKQFENVLRESGHFLRISKSILVNQKHIVGYTKGEHCLLELTDGQRVEVSRRKKTEILQALKGAGTI